MTNKTNSFQEKKFIEVFCAKCGDRYGCDHEYIPLFESIAEAIEELNSDEAWLVKGEDAFCEDCK